MWCVRERKGNARELVIMVEVNQQNAHKICRERDRVRKKKVEENANERMDSMTEH